MPLYYYNEETGDYYMAQLREASLVLPALLEDLVPNGGQFAFENSTLADTLAPYMMLLPQPPLCPVYTGANPLDDWDTVDQEALLEALDFNPRASAVYEAVDGTVIQEGSDTLRIQKNGKITFHAAESGQARFQALSAREKDLQIKAEEILDGVTAGHLGEGTMFCQSIETQEDGSVALVFCYLLNGTQVQLWEEGGAPGSSSRAVTAPPSPSVCGSIRSRSGPSRLFPSGRPPPPPWPWGRRGRSFSCAIWTMAPPGDCSRLDGPGAGHKEGGVWNGPN